VIFCLHVPHLFDEFGEIRYAMYMLIVYEFRANGRKEDCTFLADVWETL
jgi:hypothetical protein